MLGTDHSFHQDPSAVDRAFAELPAAAWEAVLGPVPPALSSG
jgi:hypothetical protein